MLASANVVQKLPFNVPLQLIAILVARGKLQGRMFSRVVHVQDMKHFIELDHLGVCSFWGVGDAYLFHSCPSSSNHFTIRNLRDDESQMQVQTGVAKLSSMYQNAQYPKKGFYPFRFNMGNVMRVVFGSGVQADALLHNVNQVGRKHYSKQSRNIPTSRFLLQQFNSIQEETLYNERMLMADNVLEELNSRAVITLQAKQSGQLPQIDHVKLIQEQDSATAANEGVQSALAALNSAKNVPDNHTNEDIRALNVTYIKAKKCVRSKIKAQAVKQLNEELIKLQGGGLQERALINQTLKFINPFAKVLNDENDDDNDSDADSDDTDSDSSDIDQVEEEDEDDDDEEIQVIDETEETNDDVYLKVMGLSEAIGASRVAVMYHHFNHLVGEKNLHNILEWSLKLGNCLWCPLVEIGTRPNSTDVRKGVYQNKHSIRHHIRGAHWEQFITIIAGGEVKENIRFIAEEYHQLMEDVMKDDFLLCC